MKRPNMRNNMAGIAQNTSVFVLVCLLMFPSVLTQITPDSQCGQSKGCFSDCDTSNQCSFLATWEEQGANVIYTLASTIVSPGDSYVLLGLSTDQSMGNDFVIGCRLDSNGVAVYVGRNPDPELESKATQTVTDNEVTLSARNTVNNILSCTVSRPIAASGERWAANQEFYYLMARGTTRPDGGRIRYHANRIVSKEKLSSSSRVHDRPSETTPQPTIAGTIVKDPGCGSTKGCFSDPDGSFEISWEVVGQKGVYTIRSLQAVPPPTFFAIGFSSDNEMGSDQVIGAAVGSNSQKIAFNSENSGKSSGVSSSIQGTVLRDDSKYENDVWTFNVERDIALTDWVDISQQKYLLFARGRASIAGDGTVSSISKHSSSNRFVSGQAVSVNDKLDISAKPVDKDLVKAHGCCMIAAWVFFASMGIITARFYKPVWKDQLCSKDIWFQIHRACMILVFCATVAGFILIFVEVEEWSDIQHEDEYLEAHPILGVIVMCLTVINPLMAFFRPHPGTANRPIFNWLHWLVGTVAHIMGVVTIFFGLKLFEDEPDYLVYILCGFAGWHVFVEILLMLTNLCCVERDRQEMYEMTDDDHNSKPSKTESKKAASIKKAIFVLHFLVVSGLSAVIIALLADAD